MTEPLSGLLASWKMIPFPSPGIEIVHTIVVAPTEKSPDGINPSWLPIAKKQILVHRRKVLAD